MENEDSGAAPQQYYASNGYYVWRNLIDSAKIDQLLARYKTDIASATIPFFRQNSSRYEKNKLTQHGYVQQSFLDIHQYKEFPEFSNHAMDIYTSTVMRDALRSVTGFQSCNLMQTMFFDANTETWPHQDWWYLDTVPNGNLLAAWFALEDIDEKAGRFFVLPKSQTVDLHSDTPNLAHTDWIERMRKYVGDHPEQVYAPALKKGDVLFWNSRLIHGSLPTKDPSFSRKSLTAHYMPSEFVFGNLFTRKEWIRYKEHNGMKYYRNQPDYTFYNKLKYGIKASVYDSPRAIKELRKIQKLFSGFRDGL